MARLRDGVQLRRRAPGRPAVDRGAVAAAFGRGAAAFRRSPPRSVPQSVRPLVQMFGSSGPPATLDVPGEARAEVLVDARALSTSTARRDGRDAFRWPLRERSAGT